MRRAVNARAILVAVVASAALASTAHGSTPPFEFRLYDPTRQIRAEVRTADLVRSSARATREPSRSGTLSFRLTTHGVATFRTLTRGLARRGARLGKRQALVLEINHTEYGRPLVDYKAFPDGLDAAGGIEIRMPLSVARMLAKTIRGG